MTSTTVFSSAGPGSRQGSHEIRISKTEAIAKRLTAGALKGDTKLLMALLKLDTDLFNTSELDAQESVRAVEPDAVDYDILRDFFSSQLDGDGGPENEEAEDDDS